TVTSLEEVEKLRPFWISLNQHPDADIDFFSFIVRAQRGIGRPFVLIVSEKEEPKALLIGRLENAVLHFKIGYLKLFKIPVRQLTFIADGPNGCLGEYTTEIARIFAAKILELLKSKVAERAVLSGIRADSELCDIVRTTPGGLQRDYARENAPHWAMSLPPTF